MMRRLALAVFMAAIGFVGGFGQASANTLQQIKARGVLVVGVQAQYPPFGFRAPDAGIIGIGPDLVRDVAKRLGVKVRLVPVLGSNRMQFLNQGRVDLLIATMNDTPQREEVIDFVKPDYYASGYNVMLPKTLALTSWAELKGKPVCAIQGAFYNKPAAEKFGLRTVAFTGATEALAAMRQGRCVGLLWDDTAIEGQLLKPEWKEYSMPLQTEDPQPWGIAVRKGDVQFAQFMSATIKSWDKTGLILKLETKYGLTRHSAFAEAAHEKYE